jgi:hypothetical protein
VGQSGAEVAIQYGVNSQDVIPIRVVVVPFVSDIVEIRKVFREGAFRLALL